MFGQFVNIPFQPPQEQGRGLDIAANIWDCPKPGPFSEAGLLTAPPNMGKRRKPLLCYRALSSVGWSLGHAKLRPSKLSWTLSGVKKPFMAVVGQQKAWSLWGPDARGQGRRTPEL